MLEDAYGDLGEFGDVVRTVGVKIYVRSWGLLHPRLDKEQSMGDLTCSQTW